MNNRYQIPRTPEFKWTDIALFEEGFELLRNDLDSALITSFDPSWLEIKLLVQLPPPIEDINEVLERNLKKLKEDGYLLLDACVCRFLLRNKKLFPESWCEITESEAFDEKSGSIRFDGTVFLSPAKEEVVLAPFCSRGSWGYGYHKSRYSENDVKTFQKNMVHREYSAVLHRKYIEKQPS